MKKLSPPLKWHGGKHYLAGKIVALMPPHLHYVEPFFGGGAVLLARGPAGSSEAINDLHGDLVNFWRVLQDREGQGTYPEFRRLCEATPFAEACWREAAEVLAQPQTGDVQRAWAFFVRCRQSLAGRMDTFAPLSRTRTRRGINEQVSAWLTTVAGLPLVHERLKRVAILGPRDALAVIRQQDGLQTLFYLDPPYLHETRSTTGEYGAHEMTEGQHRQLLDVVCACQGKVMLSGYPSGLYDYQLQGWTRHTFELPNNAAGGKDKDRMTEVLWCNF